MRRYALPSLVSFSSTAATSTRRLALRALAFFFLEGTTMPSWISILVCTSFRFPRISLFSALQQGVSFTAGCPQWRLASLCSYTPTAPPIAAATATPAQWPYIPRLPIAALFAAPAHFSYHIALPHPHRQPLPSRQHPPAALTTACVLSAAPTAAAFRSLLASATSTTPPGSRIQRSSSR
jgi:hypothetical protein